MSFKVNHMKTFVMQNSLEGMAEMVSFMVILEMHVIILRRLVLETVQLLLLLVVIPLQTLD